MRFFGAEVSMWSLPNLPGPGPRAIEAARPQPQGQYRYAQAAQPGLDALNHRLECDKRPQDQRRLLLKFGRRHREKVAEALDNTYGWGACVVVCAFSAKGHRIRVSRLGTVVLKGRTFADMRMAETAQPIATLTNHGCE
jgi:hypothetical protein